MLVLSRGKNESLTFVWAGKTFEVKILECGAKAKIGIDAPKDVRVLRSEMLTVVDGNDAGRREAA
jgi:carbon storage regulator CsrA